MKFSQNIHHNFLPYENSTLVIGFSGGPDSVYLLHYLASLKEQLSLTLIAAHLDHGWREDSKQDVLFCKKMADALNLQFVSEHAQNITLHNNKSFGGSLEEKGRIIRRKFLEQCADTHHASIVLGHHRDDQHETFFIRLFRGAGLSGLSAMRSVQGRYLRPLLNISKSEIVSYLKEHQIPYLIDETNSNTLYLRNRIRAKLIPLLKTTDKRFDRNCIRAITHLQEADNFIRDLARNKLAAISEQDLQHPSSININKFLALNPFLQKQVLLEWLCQANLPFVPSEAFFAEIFKFISAKSYGSHTLHPTWMIKKKAHTMMLLTR
jgi:tRNA(Ile)-lysidine synthase